MQKAEGRIPEKLVGDKVRLEQVLVNLIKYSLKFCYRNDIIIQPTYEPLIETLVVKIIAKGSKFGQENVMPDF